MAAILTLRRVCMRANSLTQHYKDFRYISTSKKNRETATITAVEKETCETKQEEKNWISYGFSMEDKTEDRNAMNSTMFVSVTICMVFGGFLLAYMPDTRRRDWAQREAYLEIRRREQLGLPHIDRNLVDPATIELPSDEELGQTEIII